MKNKSFSEAVSSACIIAGIIILLAHCATAQTARLSVTKPPIFSWNEYRKTVNTNTVGAWALFAGAGVAFGMREAYHAKPDCFERKWGVGSTSFWGSGAWKRNYIGNKPDNPHKHEIFGNVGRDVWHTSGITSKVFLFAGTFTIGAGKGKIKYKVVNALIGFGIQSLSTSITYNTLI